MLSILHSLSIIGCLIPKTILWDYTIVTLILQMKKLDIGKAAFLKDTLLFLLSRRARILPQAFGHRVGVFIHDTVCGRLYFTKMFRAIFLFPNPIPESCTPSSRYGVYFPSSWSYVGILIAVISSSVGEVMLHVFWGYILRGTTASTWLSHGAHPRNPVTVVDRVMFSTDHRTVANTTVFGKFSICMIPELHMNNWGPWFHII